MANKDFRKLSELHGWDKNPRAIKKQDFERLKKQIQELGQYKPLIITPDGEVLGGNMRLEAYKALGIDDVWVSVVTPKTDAEKVKYALSDNDRAGYYVEEELAELVSQYELDLNLDDFRIDLGSGMSLRELLSQFAPDDVVEDEPPAVEPDAVSKTGEVYQLGEHRLMCGDATKIEDVEKLMDGQKADMVFTDPPYGVNYVGKTNKKLTIQNDKDTNIFQESVANFSVSMKLGASIYVCCPPGNNFRDFIEAFDGDFYQSQTIIWVKNSLVLGHGDYHYQHEPILYGWLKDSKHTFYGDRKQTTVWNIDRPTRSKEHPTMKPIVLVAKAIKNSSKEGDIILDLFSGSGSTLIASEQLGRMCYGMELDPHYCDVIRKRYANFIGKGDKWQEITPIVTVK